MTEQSCEEVILIEADLVFDGVCRRELPVSLEVFYDFTPCNIWGVGRIVYRFVEVVISVDCLCGADCQALDLGGVIVK